MQLNDVVIKPIISEKSMREVTAGRYTFAVKVAAAKPLIKMALKNLFNVDVIEIKTMHVPGKRRRVGRRRTQTVMSAWKKAVVELKPDQKIDLFEVQKSDNPKESEKERK